MKRRRTFTREFKLEVLRALESGKARARVCQEYELHPSVINHWEKKHREDPDPPAEGHWQEKLPH